MEELRFRVRALILGIAGLISAIIAIRVLVQLVGASTSNGLILAIYNISNFFISPFKDAVILPIGTPIPALNVDGLIAIAIYIFLAIALSEIITAFLYDNFTDIIQNFVDAIFKVIEFLLFIRIILDLFNLYDRTSSPGFILNIFNLTDWTQGIIQNIPVLNGSLNISAIIALIIVVLIDIFSERFLATILAGMGSASGRVTKTVTTKTTTS